jgi:phosphate-selective porin OprO/OprP
MRSRNLISLSSALAAFALQFGAVAPLRADDASEIAALREQIRLLDQKLRVLERKHELAEEAAAVAAPTAAKVTVNDRGYTLASGDAASSIRLRGLVQLDARLFSGDGGIVNNAFVLRRARLISEGQLGRKFGFSIFTEFGGATVSVLDANFTVRLDRGLQFKFGKFKSPVGLEQLQNDPVTFFNERSLATNLVPNRDIGIEGSGELWGGRLNYQAGVFNGLADGGSSLNNTDFDNSKDFVGRVMVTPFRNVAASPVQGLSLGIAASAGDARSASGRTSGYRTDGQQTFFTYQASVQADGQNWRISPQLDYRRGPLGLMAEHVQSTANLRPAAGGAKTELQNRAWQVAVGYVLTGEDSSFGGVSPRTNFDLAAGTWGAFEVVARVAGLKIDDAAFPLFASPAVSAARADSYALGLNWFLGKAVVFKIDYYHTDFGLHALAPAIPTTSLLRQDEKALTSRFQLTF